MFHLFHHFGSEVFTRVEVRDITHEERKKLEYHFYGVDWGFSQDPFAWVKIAYDAKTRTLYILDEFVKCGLSNQDTAELVSEKLGNALKDGEDIIEDAEPYATVWCDSAEPAFIHGTTGTRRRVVRFGYSVLKTN